ncbi:MAG: MFS transporter [Cyanothece sp. SIO1E1]|nr:MFS transporter [Cyanothece sp. SIO1E1]
MSIPGQTMGVSVFTEPLLAATGLSRLELSNAYLVGTLASGLLLPWGGVLLDRFGGRKIAVLSAIGLAATLIYLSVSDRLSHLLSQLLAAENASFVAWVLLALGFTSLRFSGQGMLTMTSRTVLGKWFDRRRGLVSGITGVFTSFGFAAAPLILSAWINALGWRGAWLSMAVVISFGMGLVGWLLFRDNPEECGLSMDGETAGATVAAQHPGVKKTLREFSRAEALRTVIFWATTLALSCQALTVTGITFHIVDIGAEAGLPQAQTVAIFLPMAAISTVIGYLIGIAADRIQLQSLFMGMMVFLGLGLVCMAHIGLPGLRSLAIVGLGISGGCFGTLSSVTLPRFFGRTHLGAIAGIQMMSMVLASAIGPSWLALFKDQFGSYQPGLYACSILPVTVLFLVLFARDPQG